MLWIILGAIIGFIGAYADDGPLFGIFGACVGAMMGGLVALVVGGIIVLGFGDTENRVQRTELQTIADNQNTQGSFFLGSGTINEVPHYSWYEKSGPNSFVRRDVPADLATVHYTDEKPHYVVRQTVKPEREAFTWAYVDVAPEEIVEHEHYDFYVPRGTITNDYRLDAK